MTRFSLRDVFWLTLVVALLLWRWTETRVQSAREKSLNEAKLLMDWKLRTLATLIEESPGFEVTHDETIIRLKHGSTTKTQWIGGGPQVLNTNQSVGER